MAENRVFAGELISRAQLDAAGTPDDAAIHAALEALDHEHAATLALARARTATVPSERFFGLYRWSVTTASGTATSTSYFRYL